MDLATSHVGTDLDGLAALVAISLLEGPLELGLAGPMDPLAARFHGDHGDALPSLIPDAELRGRLASEPLGRLVVVGTAERGRLGVIAPFVERFASVAAFDTHGAEDADLPREPLRRAGACVSPLVLRLAERGLAPTPAQAGLFLLGIHAVTEHFLSPGTTAVDHRAAAQCVAWDAPVEWAAHYVPRGLDRHRLRPLARMADPAQRVVMERTAGDLASDPVHHIAASASVAEAGAAMHRYKVNALPLCRGDAFVGLVSRREIDDAVRHGLGDRPVSAISAGPPAWVDAEAHLEEVRHTLLSTPGRLVLVGRPGAPPAGVLTRSDVFRSAALGPPPSAGRGAPSRERMGAALGVALGPDLELVMSLGARAAELGDRLFLVGGAVRDVLLGRRVEDLDLVVLGDARRLGERAVAHAGGRLHVHDAFETCTWVTPEQRRVDLTTARTESYREPAALPDVARGGLRHDLMRRDFTINAMALEVDPARAGQLIDPFGGRRDLDARVLRVLHGLSFHDDPTRAWRAARFAGRFGFRLAAGSQALLGEALDAGFLARLSLERLGAELHKVLEEPQVTRCVALLRQWRLLAPVHPALQTDGALLDRIDRIRQTWVRHRALTGAEVGAGEAQWVALGWGLTGDDRRRVKRLVARARGRTRLWVAGPPRVRRALARLAQVSRRSQAAAAIGDLAPAELVALMAFGGPDAVEQVEWWDRRGRRTQAALTGDDLMARGVPEGAAIGRGLRAAKAAALDGADAEGQLAAALEAATGQRCCEPR